MAFYKPLFNFENSNSPEKQPKYRPGYKKKKYGWHLVIYFLRAPFRTVTRKNSANGRSATGTYLGPLRALVRSFSSVIDFLSIVSSFDNCLREFQIKGLILAGNTNRDSYSCLPIIPPLRSPPLPSSPSSFPLRNTYE